MELGRAASYFSTTPVDGWNGTDWDQEVTTVTVDPYDRFISEREFGNKRRMLLVKPDDEYFHKYSVIKLPSGDVYMVGSRNSDIQGEEYSQVVLIHRAIDLGSVYSFTKTTKASGMAGTAVRTLSGEWWADAERVTFANAKEFDSVAFSTMTLTLPRDCTIDTDQELELDGRFYDVRESYMSAGFRQCRAIAKRSS